MIRVRPRVLALDIAAATGLGVVGDVACQTMVDQNSASFDGRRTASLATFNAAYVGGFLHVLYQLYSPIVCTLATRLRAPAVLRDVVSPQHAFACSLVDNAHCGAIYIPSFFLGVGLLQGQCLDEAFQTLQSEWWPTYASCSAFWIPFMYCNMKFVAANRRVQAMAMANVAWTVVIDFFAHRNHVPQT